MKYQEAFQQAKTCYGKIKCTYAEIFNANGKRLFSCQSTDFRGFGFAANGTVIHKDNQFVPVRNANEFADAIRAKLHQFANVEPIREYHQPTGKYRYFFYRPGHRRDYCTAAELLWLIANNKTIYVKACALDWQPSSDPESVSEETATDETVIMTIATKKNNKRTTIGLLLAAAGLILGD